MTVKNKKILGIGAILLVLIGIAYYYLMVFNRLPDDIFMSNGRIEAQTIDIATRSIARIIDIPVEEGSLVSPGDVIAKLDLNTIAASLSGAEANVRSLLQQQKEAESQVLRNKSALDLAQKEYDRAAELVRRGAVSQSHYDTRQTQKSIAEASLAGAEQNLAAITESIEVARAEVNRLTDLLSDQELTAPKGGRVLYKLAEPGEVVGTGGKVVTILDLSDVYMTVFIPTNVVGKLKLMDEARIVLDAVPDIPIPAYISYISPEAQFTPRQVETRNERAKMTFRVKVRIPEALLTKRLESVKTGVPGVAYVRTSQGAVWPDFLKVRPDLLEEIKEGQE